MINVIMCALITSIACLGGLFATMKLTVAKTAIAPETRHYESAKTRMVSVPIISDGEVRGYVVARFEFLLDSQSAKSKGLPPESIVSDEAFKVIYSQARSDFKASRKTDIEGIMNSITERVKARLGSETVEHILIDTWNFLGKKDASQDERSEP